MFAVDGMRFATGIRMFKAAVFVGFLVGAACSGPRTRTSTEPASVESAETTHAAAPIEVGEAPRDAGAGGVRDGGPARDGGSGPAGDGGSRNPGGIGSGSGSGGGSGVPSPSPTGPIKPAPTNPSPTGPTNPAPTPGPVH
jgi:hypothetical protein